MGYLGCNALNLLYQYKGKLPGCDWSNMILDYANLSEANLSGKNFSCSSLRYSILYNVNLKNADFTNCDLTEAQIAETTPVQSITVSLDGNIYASYSDGIIREWIYQRVRVPRAINLYKDEKWKEIKIIANPGNNMAIVFNNRLFFYDRKVDKLHQKAVIEMRSNLKLVKASINYLLIFEDDKKLLHLINLETQERIEFLITFPFTCCDNLDDKSLVICNEETGLKIFDLTPQKRQNIEILIPRETKITCLTSCSIKKSSDEYFIGVGQYNGNVQLWRVILSKWKIEKLLEIRSHEKIVKDIAFIDDERIISGGFDKKLQLLKFSHNGQIKSEVRELKIYLQCQGIKVDGVVRDMERKKLEELSLNSIQ